MINENHQMKLSLKERWSYIKATMGMTLVVYVFLTSFLLWLDDRGVFGTVQTSETYLFTFPHWFIAPRWFIEFWFFLIFNSLGSIVSLSSVTVVWMIGIFSVVILIAVGVLVVKKFRDGQPFSLWKLPWLSLALCAWIINGFIFVSQATSTITWQMPVTELSRQFERRQFGPFFLFAQYLNRNQGFMQYSINRGSNSELIVHQAQHPVTEQQNVSLYKITPHDSNSDTSWQEIENTMVFEPNTGDEKLPNGVKCISSGRTYTGTPNICAELLFNGAVVFQEKEYGVRVRSVIHDKKNNILLIHFSPYFSDSEHVSLVKLP